MNYLNSIFYLFIKIFLSYAVLLSFHSFATEDPYQENNISFSDIEGFTFKNSIELLRVGGYIEIDGRFFLGSNSSNSTFLIRRARLFLTGELYQMFGFMLMPRWDRLEKGELHYAWLETLRPSWAQIRVGLFKKPFSLEALTTDAFLTFYERSLVVRNFLQIEDIGLMVYGELANKTLDYSVGVFNGRGRRLDNNDHKEWVGRLVYHLFSSKVKGDIYVGISGSMGKQDENLNGERFVTEADTAFWEWRDDDSQCITVNDSCLRWGMDVEWLAGPFGFRAEYLYTDWGRIDRGFQSKKFKGYGGYAECSFVLTGEDKPRDKPLIPKHNFDPCKEEWGAWEIATKYEIFYASKEMISSHFARGANYLHGPLLALNWYLNPRMLIRLNGQYIWFNRTVSLHSHSFQYETVFVCRAQALF